MLIKSETEQLAALPMTIARQGLSSAVTTRLRDMIVEGVLLPGARLNERVLCDQLAVSRTPLREAFKTLEVEGLIAILPNRGAVVVEMSAEDIAQAFDVMGALEGLSGQLACAHIDDTALAELKAMHFEMLAAHARRDLPTYYRINHAIHDGINKCARNAVLTTIYNQLNARIQSLRFRSNFNQEKWDAAVREHGAMIIALEQRDGEALRLLLQQHLRNKRDAVLTDMATRLSA
jgi:DNA-binding GntR family transcriptional regulator